jgi:trk system potassium uptake protein TrkH
MQSRVLTKRDPRLFWKSEEFRFYIKIIIVVSTILAAFLYAEQHYSCLEAFTASFYQVLSLATTTGSSSENYHLWNLDCKLILFMAMFLSSCSGSAGGGVKMTRWLLIYKYIKNEMYKILHPNAVMSIKIDNIVVSNPVIKQTMFFMFCYFLILGVSAFFITIIEKNLVIGTTAAIASLGDIGPAFGAIIGPLGNYSSLSVYTKIIFILNMLIGRLEIIPFLVLFQKETWEARRG